MASSSKASPGATGKPLDVASMIQQAYTPNTQYWLVKLPAYIMSDWRPVLRPTAGGADAPSTAPLGHLHVIPSATPGAPPELQLHSKNRQVPLTVHNKQLSGAQALAVFSDSTTGCRMDGPVALQAEVNSSYSPDQVGGYQGILQSRLAKTTTKERHTEVTTGQANKRKDFEFKSTDDKPQAKKRAQPIEKRSRNTEAQVFQMLSSLYAQKESYTLKELVELTDQPEAWLKELMAKYCDFHSKGEFMHKYTLKKEYQLNTDTDAGPGPAGSSSSVF